MNLNRNLKIALLVSLILNCAFVLSGFYTRTYDSYGHMFFADHYQKSWFDTWEPRWYMGFDVASYPPLAHQLLAIMGFLTGLEAAYVLITVILMVILPLAVYRFSKIFVSEEAAGYASLLSVLLPGILFSVYDWGQFTTLFGLVFGLLIASSFHTYIKKGGILNFLQLLFLFEAALAVHHFSGLVFVPGLLLITFLTVHFKKEISFKSSLKKTLLFSIVSLPLSIAILYPVLFGAAGQNSPIPHPTTLNYFSDSILVERFFIDVYGLFIVLLPLTTILVIRRKELLPLFLLAFFFFLLGLGGTTPIPSILFGRSWLALTYERFALFSILAFMPLVGLFCVRLFSHKRGKTFFAVFFLISLSFACLAGNGSLIRPQAPHTPVEDIAGFLDQDSHWMWRYLTLGFDTSDMSKLSIHSNATSLDGWYYRGFNITELADTGVGYFSGAKYVENGIPVLRMILENASRYNLRFVFCNDKFYEPILNDTGFQKLDYTFQQVTIWAKYDSEPLDASEIVQSNHVQSPLEYAWGILPLTWLVGLLSVSLAKVIASNKISLSQTKVKSEESNKNQK